MVSSVRNQHSIVIFVQIFFFCITVIWHFNLIIVYLHISLDPLNLFYEINSHFLNMFSLNALGGCQTKYFPHEMLLIYRADDLLKAAT